MIRPAGVVLAGGAAARMGTDKALVEVDGVPMVMWVAGALRAGGCDPVWCQGGDARRIAPLGLEVRPDEPTGTPTGARPGPVRAIASVLAGAQAPMVVIAACDLPRLDGSVVRSLVAACAAHDAVAVAVAAGRRHLVAAWPVAARRDLVAAIGRGVLSYHDVLDELGAVEVPVDADLVHNVNRPGDLPGQRYPP